MSPEDDYFSSSADAFVNPVNCQGVMGAGLALEFKKRYPTMFKEYWRRCKNGDLWIGSIHVWHIIQNCSPSYIINFPTKIHWRSPSELDYIKTGLVALRQAIFNYGIPSIAILALGCGLGALQWSDVRPLIEDMGKLMPDCTIFLYPPKENMQ